MTEIQFVEQVDFEAGLHVGDRVMVRWTNSFRAFRGLAKVTRINRETVLAELLQMTGPYPAGQVIRVPLLTMGSGGKLWSANNCVSPVSAEVTPCN